MRGGALGPLLWAPENGEDVRVCSELRWQRVAHVE